MYKLADGSSSTDYKLGDKFVVGIAPLGQAFKEGSIISFYRNDRSSSPLFKLVEGECKYDNCDGEPGAFTDWKSLTPYKEG